MARGKTVEAREREMIALAVDLAEKQLREGTAPPSVIQHYLRLGASDYPLRKERIARQNEMFEAKTRALERSDHAEEIARQAIEAMSRYQGNFDRGDIFDEIL